MKILQLVTRRQYRGAEVFAANLSKQLLSDDVEIVFAGLYPAPVNALTVNGAKNIDFNGRQKFFSFSLLKAMKELMKNEKPDIVQANGSDTLKYAVALKMSYPYVPVIYRNISMVSKWIGNNFFKKFFYKTLFSKVDHVSSVGKEAIADFVKTLSFPVSKTSVIRRGIPIQQVDKPLARAALRNNFHLEVTDKVVMHVGNFSVEKNHAFLLNVFEKVKTKDANIKLVLVGEGTLLTNIQRQVFLRKLEDTIFFAGFHVNVQQLLAGANLFVLCSTVEGVPGVVLEAGAQHVPALAVNVGGIKEVIQDDVTGMLLNSHDESEFAQTILTLLTNSNRLKEMGEQAYQMVANEFDTTRNKEAFIELYNSLLKQNNAHKKTAVKVASTA